MLSASLPSEDTGVMGKELVMPMMGIVGEGGAIRVEVYALGGRIALPCEVDAGCLIPAASRSSI